MVHQPERLVQDVLPVFFGQTKYRSFQRQLNMWHFDRILDGPGKGGFMHPFFVRGNKALCTFMSRHVHPNQVLSSATPAIPQPPTSIFDGQYNQINSISQWDPKPLDTNVARLSNNAAPDPPKFFDTTQPLKPPADASFSAMKPTPFAAPMMGPSLSDSEISNPTKYFSTPSANRKISHDETTHRPPYDDLDVDFFGRFDGTPNFDHGPANATATGNQQFPAQDETQRLPQLDLFMQEESLCPGISEPASPETVESVFKELSQSSL